MKDTDVFERLLGKEASEFGDHEAAEAVVEVGAIEGVLGETFTDGTVENDGVAGTDAEFLDALFTIFPVHLEFEEEHFRFNPFFSGALGGRGEMDGSHGLDGATIDDAIGAWLVRVLGEKFNLVPNEGTGEKGVAVDPDFSVAADAADLKSDFIGMSDKHDRGAFVITRVSVENDPGVAFELVN